MFIRVMCIIIILMSKAFAVNDVYRQENRSPGVVFEEGLLPLGTNDNVLRHIDGESCFSGTRDSAFVATTTDLGVASDLGRQVQVGEPFWIYRIRPSDNFYSAYNSLMHAYTASGINIFRETAETFRPQQEYMAFGGIAREQIRGAWMYISRGLDALPELRRYSVNPNYVDAPTDVNPDPYTRYYPPTPSSSLLTCEACTNSSSPLLSSGENNISGKIIRCRRLMAFMLTH